MNEDGIVYFRIQYFLRCFKIYVNKTIIINDQCKFRIKLKNCFLKNHELSFAKSGSHDHLNVLINTNSRRILGILY